LDIFLESKAKLEMWLGSLIFTLAEKKKSGNEENPALVRRNWIFSAPPGT
jgi:hypothetical protein